jgi:glyoxylase-like metal-dependent hydrolase (beta-lactamase superfamily II)
MRAAAADQPITFPYAEPPAPGAVLEIAPGLLWARFWLPFLLNHVNVYLIEDGDGWAAIDTGLGIDDTKMAWETLLAGPLGGKKITRVIGTHHHPDHIGLVGWLDERFGMPLYMPRTEFLFSLAITNQAFAANRPFLEERGLPQEATDRVTTQGLGYLRLVTGLPTQVQRLFHGQTLRIGTRDFLVLTGGGHAPEQAMLYCARDRIFFSADQVMTRISPNIGVPAMEPDSDPLGEYLRSLASLPGQIAEDTLVLPGHHLPFIGLGARVAELAAHHAGRCAMIAEACRDAPKTATDLLPTVFKRQLDPHQMSFAFGEVVAHINYMRGRGELTQTRGVDGILRVSGV